MNAGMPTGPRSPSLRDIPPQPLPFVPTVAFWNHNRLPVRVAVQALGTICLSAYVAVTFAPAFPLVCAALLSCAGAGLLECWHRFRKSERWF
jgi:hypothetical protein